NCGDNLVTCIDGASPNGGIVFIHGWTAGTAGPPNGAPYGADAVLTNVGAGVCSPDPYFTNVPCRPGMQATIDFGDRNVSGASVTAVVNGTNYSLTAPAS